MGLERDWGRGSYWTALAESWSLVRVPSRVCMYDSSLKSTRTSMKLKFVKVGVKVVEVKGASTRFMYGWEGPVDGRWSHIVLGQPADVAHKLHTPNQALLTLDCTQLHRTLLRLRRPRQAKTKSPAHAFIFPLKQSPLTVRLAHPGCGTDLHSIYKTNHTNRK